MSVGYGGYGWNHELRRESKDENDAPPRRPYEHAGKQEGFENRPPRHQSEYEGEEGNGNIFQSPSLTFVSLPSFIVLKGLNHSSPMTTYDGYRREWPHRHLRRENDDAPPGRQYGYEGEQEGYGKRRLRRRSEYEGEGGYGNRPRTREEGGYSVGYSQAAYGGGRRPVVETAGYQRAYETDQGIATSRVDVTKRKMEEEAAGFGGLAAGAFALNGHAGHKKYGFVRK